MKAAAQKLIADLRLSDERRKSRWVYAASAVSFAVIFFLWLALFRLTASSPSLSNFISDESLSASASPGFLASTKRGVATVADIFQRAVSGENILTVSGVSSAPVFIPVLPPEPPPRSFPLP